MKDLAGLNLSTQDGDDRSTSRMDGGELRTLAGPCAALPRPFEVEELCRLVGSARRRPIVLAALPLASAGPCGLWLATDTVDLICYERTTSGLHQQHIVLHELGHILCGHGEGAGLDDMVGGLVPQLGLDALKIMLARQHASHRTGEEREAELFAYTVLGRVGRRVPRRPIGPGPDGDMVEQLSQTLEE